MRSAILINGPPASGKTTIAKGIVATLNYPYFSLDVIKDVLFSNFGIGDRDLNRFMGSVSFQIIEKIITEFSFDSMVIIEAWFGSRIFNNVEERLNLIGINQIIEIWCHAPGVILAERYLNRINSRHRGHPGKDYAKELIDLALVAKPLRIGPVLEIDTSIDPILSFEEICKWIIKNNS